MTLGWHKRRAAQNALFGPEPYTRKRKSAKKFAPVADGPVYQAGDCPMCGGHVSCVETYACEWCGQVFAPFDLTTSTCAECRRTYEEDGVR